MAGPLRFRRSTESWNPQRVEQRLYRPLDDRFGATLSGPWFAPPEGYTARRLDMDNGDVALFAWTNGEAYWVGNTETPEVLWRTNKLALGDAPDGLGAWVERELGAQLREEEPWFEDYEHLATFFLPVLCSKDGKDSTRTFFREHAAGFPDADREAGLTFYDDLLARGVFEDFRYTMAAKLGTSESRDLVRMRATMAEFNAAKLLADAGYGFTPEPGVDDGHHLDFRVPEADVLVEVTRPEPPSRRRAGTPAAALRQTVDGKTDGQLRVASEALLLVDATSFRDDEWAAVRDERPAVGHRPAVVYRFRPDGSREGYAVGDVPLEFDWLAPQPA